MTLPNEFDSGLTVLVADDEINIRKTLSLCLETLGHSVLAVSNIRDALAEASRRSFDIAFIDLRLGAEDGFDLIPGLLSLTPWMKIVVITAYASIESAVEAMRRGACDYLPKPFTPDQVKLATDRAARIQFLENKVNTLQEELSYCRPDILLSAKSPRMNRTLRLAREVAASDATILLRGETGTGKTTLARQIHRWSNRAHKQLGIVSCPSLSADLLESELFGHVKGAFTGAVRDNPGRIAACEGGTLLLDEVGDMPLSVQPKLLRFLQDREYERMGGTKTCHADVRVISATSADLEEVVAEGRFRRELLYRLNVILIDVPPLRDRQEEILPLAEALLVFFGRKNHRRFTGFTPEAAEALQRYPWPGNVRELRNVLESAAILCKSDQVGAEHLPGKPADQTRSISLGDPVSLARIEEEHVRRVIGQAKSLRDAADVLGIDQATLWRKRKHYGV
jgi:two-component system, NtrC family, response regulator AlgB